MLMVPTHNKTLDGATATRIAGENPEYGIESLFNAIQSGNFPSWTVYIVCSLPVFENVTR